MNEKIIVDNLVKKYATNNPAELAEHMGIIILFENLGTINGYFNTAFRQKFIHVNQDLTEQMESFTIAHELGHAILHPKSNTPFLRISTFLSVSKLEIEANRFAINLLVPDEELENNKDYTVAQLSRILGYNEKLMELRLQCS